MEKKTLRGKQCQCAACGLYFTTSANFDKHRHWIDGTRLRACYDVVQLRAKGKPQTSARLSVCISAGTATSASANSNASTAAWSCRSMTKQTKSSTRGKAEFEQ